jgi:alkyl hydroperoxide reductase subunit F
MARKAQYDLIIVGAGPAGMTAGVYAARKQISTLILTENVGGQALWSSGVENYLGYIYITGAELVQKFEEHLKMFDVELEFARVVGLHRVEGGFRVDTEGGESYNARAVIVAAGKSPRLLNVPGEKEFTGRGVTYCSTCDAPLFAGMDVAVVGGGNSGLDAVIQLMRICPKVYLIEISQKLRADEILQDKVRSAKNVEILTRTLVKEIHGDDFVTGITVENLETHDQRTIDVKGVFVEIGLVPNADFVKGLVALNRYGEIPVDCGAWTGVPGLYAAGDVTDVPEKQIICAAGDGAKAALGAYSYLVRLPVSLDWSDKINKQ